MASPLTIIPGFTTEESDLLPQLVTTGESHGRTYTLSPAVPEGMPTPLSLPSLSQPAPILDPRLLPISVQVQLPVSFAVDLEKRLLKCDYLLWSTSCAADIPLEFKKILLDRYRLAIQFHEECAEISRNSDTRCGGHYEGMVWLPFIYDMKMGKGYARHLEFHSKAINCRMNEFDKEMYYGSYFKVIRFLKEITREMIAILEKSITAVEAGEISESETATTEYRCIVGDINQREFLYLKKVALESLDRLINDSNRVEAIQSDDRTKRRHYEIYKANVIIEYVQKAEKQLFANVFSFHHTAPGRDPTQPVIPLNQEEWAKHFKKRHEEVCRIVENAEKEGDKPSRPSHPIWKYLSFGHLGPNPTDRDESLKFYREEAEYYKRAAAVQQFHFDYHEK